MSATPDLASILLGAGALRCLRRQEFTIIPDDMFESDDLIARMEVRIEPATETLLPAPLPIRPLRRYHRATLLSRFWPSAVAILADERSAARLAGFI